MAKKRYAVFHLVFLLVLIAIAANVSRELYAASVQDFNEEMNLDGEKVWELPNNGTGRALPTEEEDPVVLGDSSDGIMYFIQVGLQHLLHDFRSLTFFIYGGLYCCFSFQKILNELPT